MTAARRVPARSLLRPAATVLAGALLLPALALPALAVDDPTTGYWTRTRIGAPLPVQPPDPVPEGGSWVSGDPSGPVAVTAVRAGADVGSVVVGLRLPIADAVGTPAVLVCPTTDRWAPEQGGRLEAAPPADCTAPVETVVEGEVLVVALPALLQTDVVDVLLTPAEGSAFSMTFERATAEAVVQAPASSSLGPAPAPAPAPADDGGFAPPPPSFDTGSGFGGGFSDGALLPAPDPGAPALAGEPLLPPPALPEPAAAGVPQPQAAPPAPAALAAQPATAPLDRTASLLALALLVALAAVALRLAVQPAVAPRHLGGGARLSRAGAVAAAPSDPSPAGPAAAAAGAAAPAAAGAAARGVGRFRSARVRPPVRI